MHALVPIQRPVRAIVPLRRPSYTDLDSHPRPRQQEIIILIPRDEPELLYGSDGRGARERKTARFVDIRA